MFIAALIAFFFLIVGLIFGFALGVASIGALDVQNSQPVGKPKPEATVVPREAQLTKIRVGDGEIHLIANPEALDKAEFDEPPKVPPVSPDVTQMNVTLDPDFPIEDYMQMWFDQNYDVDKRKN